MDCGLTLTVDDGEGSWADSCVRLLRELFCLRRFDVAARSFVILLCLAQAGGRRAQTGLVTHSWQTLLEISGVLANWR